MTGLIWCVFGMVFGQQLRVIVRLVRAELAHLKEQRTSQQIAEEWAAWAERIAL